MMLQNKIITINSRKMDGSVHKTWKADLIEETDELLALVGSFKSEVKHPALGVIRRDTVSYEFFWKTRWFSIYRFHEPDGVLRNFYCNVNLPPTFNNDILDFIDLDLDILVHKDFTFEILDWDEFDQNARKYDYSREIIENARQSLADLKRLIVKRIFPFDYEISGKPNFIQTDRVKLN